MPLLETDILAGLIDRKLQCVRQLAELSQRQRELITAGEMTRLLKLLALKQRIMIALEEIERELSAFRNQDPESRRWRSADDRRRCAAQLEECSRLLAAMIELEQLCEHAMVQRRDEVSVQLHGAHLAGQARSAYVELPPLTMNQIDLTAGT